MGLSPVQYVFLSNDPRGPVRAWQISAFVRMIHRFVAISPALCLLGVPASFVALLLAALSL
jgi:hypothetical protein